MKRSGLREKRIDTPLKIQKIINAIRHIDYAVDSIRDKENTIDALKVKQKNLNCAMFMLEEIVFDGIPVAEVYSKNRRNPVAIKLAMAVMRKSHHERNKIAA